MAYPYILFITTLLLLQSIPSHQINLIPTISSAPAVLPDPPLPPPTQVLSPDIAPLLPSPGAAAQTPAGLSVPTIPSTRSPNPDTLDSVGPDTAVAPSGSFMDSSAVSRVLVRAGSKVDVLFSCFFAFWVVCFVNGVPHRWGPRWEYDRERAYCFAEFVRI